MPTEQKIITSADESRDLTEQITELETLLQKSESLRKKQLYVSACALLSMILILTLAILNLAAYLRNYPKKELMREVFYHARPILYTPWNIRGNTPGEKRILKQTGAELEKALKAYMPQIRHAMRQSVRSLKQYTFTELRRLFSESLYTSLQIRSSRILEEHKIRSNSGTAARIRELNQHLAEKITEKIFDGLKQASVEKELFRQESFDLIRSAEMDRMKREPVKILEERLMTAFLEILQNPGAEEPRNAAAGKGTSIHHE